MEPRRSRLLAVMSISPAATLTLEAGFRLGLHPTVGNSYATPPFTDRRARTLALNRIRPQLRAEFSEQAPHSTPVALVPLSEGLGIEQAL
jgi:hypothetical protein